MGTPGLQGRGGTVAGARSRGRGTQEKGKWFLRWDVFGHDGFAVAVVEPEARRYTKICKKGRIPLIPAIPGIPIVPGIPGRMFSRRDAEARRGVAA